MSGNRTLHISDALALPRSTATSTLVVYGGKGMGKTNFGAVLCEEFSAAGLRFAVIDPMGVMWGLRHSPDGKGPGIQVLILGGKHGDIPIEPTGGEVVADLIADENVDVIIDISRRADGTMWSIGERIRFVTAYCKRLYARQGERARPLMQIIDEAARFVPQTIPHGSPDIAACVGAIEAMVEEGRNIGIGVCLLTQRSARMNKSVSELADCMIAFRTVGPRSVEAVLDWLGEHIPKDRWKDMVEQLRKLPIGSALTVSPGWLDFEGVVPMRMRQTFDSSATPVEGKERRASGAGAKPDLTRYQTRMAETIERAKSIDPRLLQKRIAELERAQSKGVQGLAPTTVETKTVEKLVVSEREIATIRKLVETVATERETTAKRWETLHRSLDELLVAAHRINAASKAASTVPPSRPVAPPKGQIVPRKAAIVPRKDGNASGDAVSGGELKVLTVVGQYPAGATREQITIIAGYKRSTRDRYLQYLSAKGLVSADGSLIQLTQAGADALPADFEPLPTGDALREYWLSRLPAGERELLRPLLEAYPNPVDRETLSSVTDYKRSTRDRYLQYLAVRKLIVTDRNGVTASAVLFE